jgi:adenosylhomocysteinase
MVLIIKPYPYGQRSGVHSYLYLKYPGIRLEYLEDLPPSDALLTEVVDYCRHNSTSGKFIVIEDGGYIIPFLHEKYSGDDSPCIGGVEQTTKGLRKDEQLKSFRFSILNVAKSKFKDEYESPLVGHAIVYNILRLLSQESFFGKKALVVGFGAIGRAVADALTKSMGMIVRIYDKELDRIAAARVRGYEASVSASDFVRDAKIIIGTTGYTSIGKDILEVMDNGAILVSASSDQIEIDLEHLRIMCHSPNYREGLGTYYDRTVGAGSDRYLLLGDGFPINFFVGSGIPDKAIDPILAQLFIGAVHLATEYKHLKPGVLNEMDDLIVRYKLLEDFVAEHSR